MKKLLGPHLGGLWANKLDVLRQWQPPLMLVLSPDVEKVTQLREACPSAIIVGRFYHDDNHYASNIAARPSEFAREIHQEIVANPVTPLLDYVQSNNETNQSWDGIQKLNEYTQAWMALADQSGAYKCAILAFSVGNPDMPHKPGDPAGFDGRMLYWQQVLPSLNYAQRNNHLLLLHAYGYPNMFAPDADWYIYRYERQVQAHLRTLGITDLKYVYGEIGIDRLIVNGKGGYKVVTTDQDYTNQLLQWERDQQAQSLLLGGAIFTFGDSGGWDSYDIASGSAASMLAAHYVEHADDYESPQGDAQKYSSQQETYLPSISPGTVVTPALPPVEWDPRLTARGVVLTECKPKPGETYMRLVRGEYWEEKEHTFAETLGKEGKRLPGITMRFWWGNGNADQEQRKVTELKPNDRWMVDFPMFNAGRSYGLEALGYPSDSVFGMGLGSVEQPDWNIHVSYMFAWQLTVAPAIEAPPPTPVEPARVTPLNAYVVTIESSNIRTAPIFADNVDAVSPVGSHFRVSGDAGEFYEIEYMGGKAYVHKSVVSRTDVEPTEPTPSGDNWARAYPEVLKIEGGLSLDPNDSGNYYQGKLVGTKYGISAAVWGGQHDIPNLTEAQALEIYKRHYWDAAGCNEMAWPMCLIHFDTAIQHGVGVANALLHYEPTPEEQYLGQRALRYMDDPNWRRFGEAWGVRVDNLQDIAKEGN